MNDREKLIYRIEQRLLHPDKRDCPACKGEGCSHCGEDGSLYNYIRGLQKSYDIGFKSFITSQEEQCERSVLSELGKISSSLKKRKNS